MYIANVNFLWPNSGPMKSIPLLLALTASALAAEPVELFNGKNLTGWKAPTGTWTAVQSVGLDPANNKAFLSTPGTGVLLNSNADKTLNIESAGEWGDCELHVEFCVPKGSNSGIYLQGRYEVQVFDSFGKAEVAEHDCGAIYQRWENSRGKGKEGYEGHAPNVNASKPPGEWQSFDIVFRAALRCVGQEDRKCCLRKGPPQREGDSRERRVHRPNTRREAFQRSANWSDPLAGRPRPGRVSQPQTHTSMKLGFVGSGNRLSVVGQFELTRYLPETSAMKSATKCWISAGGRL